MKSGNNEIRLKQFRLFLNLFQRGFVRLGQNFLPAVPKPEALKERRPISQILLVLVLK